MTISEGMLWHTWPPTRSYTVAKFLYQGYILIFGAQARLLGRPGVNFISNITGRMCRLLSMKKLQTMPCHPQTNGLVERSCWAITWMIRKLGEDKKANWTCHLAEIVHPYNATQSAVMGYSPDYLMFGCGPRLLVNFYFPTSKAPLPSMWMNT